MKERILIYDGDCEFCRRQVEFLRRHDVAGRIRAVAFQENDPARYGVSRAAAEEAMHLVAPDGRVWRGSAAAREVLALIPSLSFLTWLFRLPGAMFIAERAYRWVARRRHRFGCASAACGRGTRYVE
jgi:predicted DCC family thiol-disulfide oxidoreductase YuxK